MEHLPTGVNVIHFVQGLVKPALNLLKMRMVLLALYSFQKCLMGHTVALMSDDTVMVAYVNKKGSTVSWSMCLLAREV